MEFRQIRYFLEIRRTGSFSRAATALGLTQPALSRQISLLERELGITLFERQGREIRPTPAGLRFQGQAVRLQDLWQETLEVMHQDEGGLSGIYSISTGGTVAGWVLPGILSRIRREHPGTSFRLIEGDANQSREAVKRGDVDLGIMTGPVEEPGLVELPYIQDRIVPVVGREHPLALKRRVTLKDLRKEEFVLFHPASAIRRVMEQRFRSIKPRFVPEVAMELRSVESVIRTVEAGLGIGFLSELTLTPDLVALDVPELTSKRRFFFCHRTHHRPGIARLIEAIARETKADSSLEKMIPDR